MQGQKYFLLCNRVPQNMIIMANNSILLRNPFNSSKVSSFTKHRRPFSERYASLAALRLYCLIYLIIGCYLLHKYDYDLRRHAFI